jgi:histidinol-phosphatase (PHP family)
MRFHPTFMRAFPGADRRNNMLPRSNVHTHTNFSDGRDSAEQMVLAALERGFVSLGFSDHGLMKIDPAGMTREADYLAEILRLKDKYAGQLDIALGYEHDFAARGNELHHYEYLIESVHWLEKDGMSAHIDSSAARLQQAIDEMYSGDAYAMCLDYFNSVCRSITEIKADVVGQIGLVTKFNEHNEMFDASDARYVRPAMDTVALAAEKDILVEINTGAMSRGYRSEPYPSLDLLKHLRALGGRITITSDCHRAEWIDFAFDNAIALAQSAGFREAWIWENGGFRAKGL